MTEGEIIALIGLAGVLITNLIQLIIQNRSIKRKLDTMSKRFDSIEEHNDEQYLDILRLTIMSDNMPVSERIIAGKKYIDRGGNGDVKLFYQGFLNEHTK